MLPKVSAFLLGHSLNSQSPNIIIIIIVCTEHTEEDINVGRPILLLERRKLKNGKEEEREVKKGQCGTNTCNENAAY